MVDDIHAFRHLEREQLTDQERAKLFLDRGGICHRCTNKIRPGRPWYDEHLKSLATGGTNAWSNRALTCENCFHPKNADDAKQLAKQRAVAVAHVIPPSQRQKKGRPIPGSKRSGWKHLMNGRWERR